MRFPATVIDLSTLPKPQIIDTIVFDDIVASMKLDAIARATSAGITLDTLNLESEPSLIIFEACATREMILRELVNDDALALLLAFATGGDLDQIGARFGVLRMVVYAADGVTVIQTETDTRFRSRIQLAPDAYSNAGTLRAYLYHVLSASLEIIDANIISPAPGRVDIILLGDTGIPSDTATNAVYTRVTSIDVKPLTDDVRVYKTKILPYVVSAILRIPNGPNPAVILAAGQASARAYAVASYKVGGKVYSNGYIGALQVPNVFEAIVASPLTNLDPGSYGTASPSFNITTEVVDG